MGSTPATRFPGRMAVKSRGAITTDFVLVPGAGGVATPYWRLVSAKLRVAGHRALPVDLPGEAPDRGSSRVCRPHSRRHRRLRRASCRGPVHGCLQRGDGLRSGASPPVHPGQRHGARARGDPGEWWTDTGATAARIAAAKSRGYDTEFDITTYFLHDLGPEDTAAVLANPGDEADIAFGQPCDVAMWPDVPTATVIGRDDRLFPLEFQRAAGARARR